MTEILPGLWMGGAEEGGDPEWVASKGIGFIINCTPDLPMIKGVTSKRIAVTDSRETVRERADAIMFNHLADITKQIHLALGKGLSVLVHCFAGRQRSATVVTAYLIRFGRIPLAEAERLVQSKRIIAFTPSNNFRMALSRFEQLYAKGRR